MRLSFSHFQWSSNFFSKLKNVLFWNGILVCNFGSLYFLILPWELQLFFLRKMQDVIQTLLKGWPHFSLKVSQFNIFCNLRATSLTMSNTLMQQFRKKKKNVPWDLKLTVWLIFFDKKENKFMTQNAVFNKYLFQKLYFDRSRFSFIQSLAFILVYWKKVWVKKTPR